ncbi:diguanylate cyclase, partial [Paenibacillus sp.]|uniref:diguanylate cyclase n=1 Tax=Paenibacillus sp. TaxID=58172 RepID=UPI0028B1A232
FFANYSINIISNKIKTPKSLLYMFYGVCNAAIACLIISQFNNMYYYIDEYNRFHFNSLSWLASLWMVIFAFIQIAVVFYYRKALGYRESFLLLSYMALPMLALIFSDKFQGLDLFSIAVPASMLLILKGHKASRGEATNIVKLKNSIKTKLWLSIGFFAVIVLLVGGVAVLNQERTTVREESLDDAQQYNALLAADLSAYFQIGAALAVKTSLNDSIMNWMKDDDDLIAKKLAFEELSDASKFINGNMFNIVLLQSGNVYKVDENTVFYDFKPYKKLAKSNRFKEIIVNPDTFTYLIDSSRYNLLNKIYIVTNVMDGENSVGTIDIGVGLNDKIKSIFDANQKQGMKSVIINKEGQVVIDYDTKNINKNLLSDDMTMYSDDLNDSAVNWLTQRLNEDSEPTSIQLDKNRNHYIAFAPIHGTDCYAVTFYETSGYYIRNVGASLSLIFMPMFLYLALLIYILRKSVMVPLNELQRVVNETTLYKEMDMTIAKRKDEIGILAQNIKNMADNLVKSIPVGIFITTPDTSFEYANAYFLQQFKFDSLEEFKTALINNPDSFHVNIEDYFKIKDIVVEGKFEFADKIRFIDKEGTPFWAEMKLTKKELDNGKFCYEGILINVDEAEAQKKSMIEKMYTDRLTNVYNRVYFYEIAIEKVKECREADNSVYLIIFDLDNFKQVNDTYGHNVGDEVLIETAEIAKSCLRSGDILCRWGGEEFIVILLGASTTSTYNVASKIREQMEAHTSKTAGKVTASIGFAELSYDDSITELIKHADEALYEAKKTGRNKIIQYQVKLD